MEMKGLKDNRQTGKAGTLKTHPKTHLSQINLEELAQASIILPRRAQSRLG